MSQEGLLRQRMRERLSTLLDGEDEFRARAPEAIAFVRAASVDAESRSDWLLYSQIGDILRSADLAPLSSDERFLARVSAAVAQEPIVVVPAAAAALPAAAARSRGAHRRPHWSTRMAAGMAAVGGVAVMAWVALPGLHEAAAPGSGGRAIVASAVAEAPQSGTVIPARVAVEAAPPADAALVQARLSAAPRSGAMTATPVIPVSADMPMVEYLLAHQQLAGGMMPVVPATLRVDDPQPSAR